MACACDLSAGIVHALPALPVLPAQDGVDFLSWTYFYRRLTRNPGYYQLDDHSDEVSSLS